MPDLFFDHPILNSPYERPSKHWELDAHGQPTQRIIESRRRAEFITPIPKPKKRKVSAAQQEMILDEGKGLSTQKQQYDITSIINEVRSHVETWRSLPSSGWQVSPETTRLLQHWRHHNFGGVRPFFCQTEAVETTIWLTEVAPHRPPVNASLITLPQRTETPIPNFSGSPSSSQPVRARPLSWPCSSHGRPLTLSAVLQETFYARFSRCCAGSHHQRPPPRPSTQRPGQLLRESRVGSE